MFRGIVACCLALFCPDPGTFGQLGKSQQPPAAAPAIDPEYRKLDDLASFLRARNAQQYAISSPKGIDEGSYVTIGGIEPPMFRNEPPVPLPRAAAICYDAAMRKTASLISILLLSGPVFVSAAPAQTATGALEFTALITPTAARPEPVRQFTFFILTRSYSDIVKEAEEKDPVPSRDEFIDSLKVSTELRAWLKAHDTLDLTSPDLDKLLTPDDLLHVPEFLLAYQRSNSGGVTSGFPKPKYTDAIREQNPAKYEKLKQDYMTALLKFIRAHPETVSGVELELDGVNPQRKWDTIQSARRKRVQRAAPDVAQLKFLAAKADTDLEGHASVSGLPPGDYWISTLNLEANAGDMRVHWDVPVKIAAGETARVELSNLNTTEASSSNP